MLFRTPEPHVLFIFKRKKIPSYSITCVLSANFRLFTVKMSFFCLMQEFYKYFFKGKLEISVKEGRKSYMLSYIGVKRQDRWLGFVCCKLCKSELVIFGLSCGDL